MNSSNKLSVVNNSMISFGIILMITIITSCTKESVQEHKKVISTHFIVDDFNPELNIPYKLDLNEDGISDIKITGKGTYSGSSGSIRELFIKGINGSRVCYQTHHDTSWVVDVFTGSHDTLIGYSSFKQPTSFNLGDQFNSQLDYSDSTLMIYQLRYNGSMSIPSSNVVRDDLIIGNFMYFVVETPSGFHWVKIKPGTPKTILESHSLNAGPSGMIIHE